MKIVLSILLSTFLGFMASSQESQTSPVFKSEAVTTESFNNTNRNGQGYAPSEDMPKNLGVNSKSETILRATKNTAAIQAKIDYLNELACCKEEILELEKQQLNQTIK